MRQLYRPARVLQYVLVGLLMWWASPALAGNPPNDSYTNQTKLVLGQVVAGSTLEATATDSSPVSADMARCDPRNLPDVWYHYSEPCECTPLRSLVLRIRSTTAHLVRAGGLLSWGGGDSQGHPGQLLFGTATCGTLDPAVGFLELKLGPVNDAGSGIPNSFSISLSSLGQGGDFTVELAYDTPAPVCTFPVFRVDNKYKVYYKRYHGRRRVGGHTLKRVTVWLDSLSPAEPPCLITLSDGARTIIAQRPNSGGKTLFIIPKDKSYAFIFLAVTVTRICAAHDTVSCIQRFGLPQVFISPHR